MILSLALSAELSEPVCSLPPATADPYFPPPQAPLLRLPRCPLICHSRRSLFPTAASPTSPPSSLCRSGRPSSPPSSVCHRWAATENDICAAVGDNSGTTKAIHWLLKQEGSLW
ncbi:unnamed protein product [Urochloa humidicola]